MTEPNEQPPTPAEPTAPEPNQPAPQPAKPDWFTRYGQMQSRFLTVFDDYPEGPERDNAIAALQSEHDGLWAEFHTWHSPNRGRGDDGPGTLDEAVLAAKAMIVLERLLRPPPMDERRQWDWWIEEAFAGRVHHPPNTDFDELAEAAELVWLRAAREGGTGME